MLKKLAGYSVDLVTTTLLLLALYLLFQPGSQLRTAWAQHRAAAEGSRASTRLWDDLSKEGSKLYSYGGHPQLIEISSYDCVFCRRVNPSVDSAVAAGVRVAYLNLPSLDAPHASDAAIAALCAEPLGHFRGMHDRLMNSAQWRNDGDWIREARAAGVTDLAAFERCIAGPAVRRRLAAQRTLAESLRVNVTPTFITPGVIERGMRSTQALISTRLVSNLRL